MKTTSIISVIMMLLVFQLSYSQQTANKENSFEKNKSILMEAGINVSLPVHIQMFRTHRYAVGLNFRAFKKISSKTEIGLKLDYDYRFARKIPDTTDTVKEKASHRNFSLIALKANVQFNFNHDWFFGAETGVGYALSDANGAIGLGFVSEYDGNAKFGSCSGLYIGKYLSIGQKHNNLEASMNLTNFLLKGHAENSLGLRLNYCFNK
ncbi:hypothetical protein [Flavobacterium granuli]|uniref:Outer membrane protein beta-barrel domain-containing protein n=1 Tax=Flavobacterium granuli TaxID=280093 RepID=A0A1M5I4T2_9FLAO|nr:hypothetical protein [Flavobacterium granuli]PRZ27791.1 hypothetical protein BC624_10171 [Flavobacterium granuli]SHG23308.1 hypothetical protein SAMN05443373_10171 [Flavobacterium granuli]